MIAHLNMPEADALWCMGAMVYEVLQQRIGRRSWSHQYGHNQCPFNDKADALAKQAAATHPLQLRPCVLRRLGESLAPSGSCSVQPKRDIRVSASFGPTAVKGIVKTERASGLLGITQCQAKNKHNTAASAITNFGAPTRSVNASK